MTFITHKSPPLSTPTPLPPQQKLLIDIDRHALTICTWFQAMQGHVWVSPPPVIMSCKNKIIWFSIPTTSKELSLGLGLELALLLELELELVLMLMLVLVLVLKLELELVLAPRS